MPYVGSTLSPAAPPSIVLEMHNAYFVGLNHKGKIWSVRAKSVQIGQDRTLTTLTGVTQGRIFDGGKVALQLEAGRALYNSMVGDLVMDQGIKLTGPGGQKLTARGADWNAAASSLRSTGKVYYESPWARGSTGSVFVDTKGRELTMYNVDVTVDLSKADKGQHAL